MDITILLIDDDIRILETFARTLNLAGYAVLTARDGGEGLALYHQHRPDIILLDLRMPGIDGLEVLQEIREHDPEANVILSTGHGDKNAVIEALRAGASDFLSKPIDQVSLESALRRAEERTQLKRKLRASQEALRQQNEQLEEMVETRTADLEREVEEHQRTEDALRKREKQYRVVSELVSDYAYAFRVEADGTLVGEWVTEAFYRITGYTPDELPTGTSWARIFHPEDLPAVTDHIATLVDGTPHELDYRIRTKAGEVRWLRTHNRPEWDAEAGRVTRIYGAVQDITERKRAEFALRESEQRYRAISELTSDFAYAVRVAPDGTYVPEWGTKEIDVFTGYTRDEMREIGGWEALIHSDDRQVAQQHFQSLFSGRIDTAEFRIVTPNGETRWLRNHAHPIHDEAAGRIVRIIGAAQDVTKRKRAEEALHQYAKRLRIQHEIDTAILIAQSPLEIARATLTRLHDLIPYQRASITEIDSAQEQGRTIVVLDGECKEKPDNAWRPFSRMGRMIDSLQTGRVYVLEDLAALEHPSSLEGTLVASGARSAISVPLMAQDRLIGSLNLASNTPDFFKSDHVKILEEIASSLTVALQQADRPEQT